MKNKSTIQFLRNKEIDFSSWDKTIYSAGNSKIFALSWYLDYTAGKWDALIYGDYDFVMPLTSKKKLWINYLYQPWFCQQLGIFPSPEKEIQELFASKIKELYLFTDIQINAQNNPDSFDGFTVKPRTNLILPLIDIYPDLYSQFSKNTQRNIAKAAKEKVSVIQGIDSQQFVLAKKKCNLGDMPEISFDILGKIISKSQSDGIGIILAAYSEFNELCAGAFLLRTGNRFVYLSAFSTDTGKNNSAMYAIVDHFIREYAGSGFLLDFEGSSLEGVARFYKGFGSFSETYYHLYRNNLPFPLKYLKNK